MRKIRVLEIGIDQGHSCFPIIHNLCAMYDDFEYIGVDVKMNPAVMNGVDQMAQVIFRKDSQNNPNVKMYQVNSLTILPMMVAENDKFDIIFLDGDHNYFTVSNELQLAENLCNPWSIIVCDDYYGRYSEKDLFYSEREAYENLRANRDNTPELSPDGSYIIDPHSATPPIRIHEDGILKQGVKTAVDEFIIGRNQMWKCRHWTSEDGLKFEPVILYQHDHVQVRDNSENMIEFKNKESKKRFIIND